MTALDEHIWGCKGGNDSTLAALLLQRAEGGCGEAASMQEEAGRRERCVICGGFGEELLSALENYSNGEADQPSVGSPRRLPQCPGEGQRRSAECRHCPEPVCSEASIKRARGER